MDDYARLNAVIEARCLELDLDYMQLAARAGVSDVSLRNWRRGRTNPKPLSKRRVEDALEWQHGSWDVTLAGGDPTPTENGDNPEPDAEEVQQLRAEIEELRAEIKRLSDRKRRRASEKDTPDLADTEG